jgi:hypothetical protein
MTMTTALIAGLTSSIRLRCASTISELEASLDLMISASLVALMRQSSVAVAIVTVAPPSTWRHDDDGP